MPKRPAPRRVSRKSAPAKRARTARRGFDPMLMAVLSSRLEAIVREMSNTVMKASRSAAITNARDMSCALLTFDNRLICVEESMPIHTSSLEINTRVPSLRLQGPDAKDLLQYRGNSSTRPSSVCAWYGRSG